MKFFALTSIRKYWIYFISYVRNFFWRYGVTHLSRVGSVFTTLSISIQHYLVLQCYAKERQFGGLLIPISWTSAIVFNLPRFFEFKTTPTILVDDTRNGSISPLSNITNLSDSSELIGTLKDLLSVNGSLFYHQTYDREIRKNPAYVLLYLFWGRIILIELIPYIITISINISVRRKLRNLSSLSNTDYEDGTYYWDPFFG